MKAASVTFLWPKPTKRNIDYAYGFKAHGSSGGNEFSPGPLLSTMYSR
jgi:hypothetical protein